MLTYSSFDSTHSLKAGCIRLTYLSPGFVVRQMAKYEVSLSQLVQPEFPRLHISSFIAGAENDQMKDYIRLFQELKIKRYN